MSTTIALPPPFQRRLEALASDLLQPPAMPTFDFATPPGERALMNPDSVSWRVFKNPVALFVGGIAAVLLELAEPRVRDGVWQHSTFRQDALTRLRRTGLAAMIAVYGPRSKAEAMIAGVVKAHDRVNGTTTEGVPYQANDPELLDWVQATTGYGFIGAYSAYVRCLSGEEFDRAYAEAAPAARLFGAHGAPRSRAEYDRLLKKMEHLLVGSPIIHEFLDIMLHVNAFPVAARPLQRMLVRAAVDLLPAWLRRRLELGPAWSLRRWERPIVRAAAIASDRLILRSSPAVQSCRRLGLPDNYLYQR